MAVGYTVVQVTVQCDVVFHIYIMFTSSTLSAIVHLCSARGGIGLYGAAFKMVKVWSLEEINVKKLRSCFGKFCKYFGFIRQDMLVFITLDEILKEEHYIGKQKSSLFDSSQKRQITSSTSYLYFRQS